MHFPRNTLHRASSARTLPPHLLRKQNGTCREGAQLSSRARRSPEGSVPRARPARGAIPGVSERAGLFFLSPGTGFSHDGGASAMRRRARARWVRARVFDRGVRARTSASFVDLRSGESRAWRSPTTFEAIFKASGNSIALLTTGRGSRARARAHDDRVAGSPARLIDRARVVDRPGSPAVDVARRDVEAGDPDARLAGSQS